MTGQDVIDEARRYLNDSTAEGYRFEPADVLNWLNQARQELYKRRPDIWLATDGSMTALTDLTTVTLDTTTLTEGLDQQGRLAYWIAYKASLGDSADEQQARQAMEFRALFESAT